MRFEVIDTVWGADDEVFGGGVHEIAKPTSAFLALLAGAEAAGAVRILEASTAHRAKIDRHVQSQEDAEAEYEKAQADGRWRVSGAGEVRIFVENGVRSRDLEAAS